MLQSAHTPLRWPFFNVAQVDQAPNGTESALSDVANTASPTAMGNSVLASPVATMLATKACAAAASCVAATGTCVPATLGGGSAGAAAVLLPLPQALSMAVAKMLVASKLREKS
jgi:hypothetical protein